MVLPSAGAPASHSHQVLHGISRTKTARIELASTSDEYLSGSHQSTLTSPTDTHVNNALDASHSPTRRPRWGLLRWFISRTSTELDNAATVHLNCDVDVDPGPFSFKASQLSSLVDSKDLDALQALGGVDGLLQGLGTHTLHGLIGSPDNPPPDAPDKPPPHLGPKPGDVSLPELPDFAKLSTEHPAYNASLEDRARVYGANSLPARKSKSIWQLMWAAYNEKVLVRSLVLPQLSPFLSP